MGYHEVRQVLTNAPLKRHHLTLSAPPAVHKQVSSSPATALTGNEGPQSSPPDDGFTGAPLSHVNNENCKECERLRQRELERKEHEANIDEYLGLPKSQSSCGRDENKVSSPCPHEATTANSPSAGSPNPGDKTLKDATNPQKVPTPKGLQVSKRSPKFVARPHSDHHLTTAVAHKARKLVTHHMVMVREPEKFSELLKILTTATLAKRIIIYVGAHRKADWLARQIRHQGHYKVASTHYQKAHREQQQNIKLFHEKQLQVMVATDFIAHGTHVSSVAHVVNYDMPETMEAYRERIQCIGRAHKAGKVTNFLTPCDQHLFYELGLLANASKHKHKH